MPAAMIFLMWIGSSFASTTPSQTLLLAQGVVVPQAKYRLISGSESVCPRTGETFYRPNDTPPYLGLNARIGIPLYPTTEWKVEGPKGSQQCETRRRTVVTDSVISHEDLETCKSPKMERLLKKVVERQGRRLKILVTSATKNGSGAPKVETIADCVLQRVPSTGDRADAGSGPDTAAKRQEPNPRIPAQKK